MKGLRKTFYSLSALALSMTGCNSGQQLQSQLTQVKRLTQQARENGATRCTPKELALAVAYTDFAEKAIQTGSLSSAMRHLERAELNALAAKAQSPRQYCLPTSQKAPLATKQAAAEPVLAQNLCSQSSTESGERPLECFSNQLVVRLADCDVESGKMIVFENVSGEMPRESLPVMNLLLSTLRNDPSIHLAILPTSRSVLKDVPVTQDEKKRAELISSWLVERGIDPEQIIAHTELPKNWRDVQASPAEDLNQGTRFIRIESPEKECATNSDLAKGSNDN